MVRLIELLFECEQCFFLTELVDGVTFGSAALEC